MSRHVGVFSRGTVRPGTELPHLVGRRCYFDDVATPSGNSPLRVLSGMEVEAVIVINDSGGTLSPKKVVAWKAGYVGTKVGGLNANEGRGAGVVDPFLTSDVADGEQFLLIVKGPTTVLAHDDAITAGLGLVSQGSGRVDGYAANGDADIAVSYLGTYIEAPTAQDDEIRAVVDFRY